MWSASIAAMAIPSSELLPACKLHPSPIDGVEEELEGAFGLGAVLDAESEHYDFAFAACEADCGGFTLKAFGAVGVAGD